jgi:hypothetical protein
MNLEKIKNLSLLIFSSIFSLLLANFFYLFLIKSSNQASGLSRNFFYDLPAPLRWHYPDIGTTETKSDIAILGDSYAEGSGDAWLNGEYKYSMMHYLNDKGISLALFGSGGSYPRRQIKYFEDSLNGKFYPLKNSRNLEDYPKKVLITIYGGNDLEDALEDFYEPEIQHHKDNIPFFVKYFPLLDILTFKIIDKERWGNRFKKLSKIFNIEKRTIETEYFLDKIEICRDERCLSVKDDMQADSLNLNQDQVELGIRLISESISNFAKRYPGSVCVVYIPSPSLIYKIDNFIPKTYYIKGTKDLRYSFSEHNSKSIYIREQFSSLFRKNSIYFIDSTFYLSEIGSKEIIHGEKDHNHFNKDGYKYLANWLYTKHNKCLN